MRRLIVTGDDFGLAVPVNEAIEAAHRDGVLTTASLMVSGRAADDAVERARRLPTLRVGLHVVLVEGISVLPPKQIPDLVDEDGAFPRSPLRAGLRLSFLPRARQQLEAEIRAQFEAFRRTGLALDHVNAHNHLHPTVLRLLLTIGADCGARAIRVPYEPSVRSWRAAGEGGLRRALTTLVLAPWTLWLRWRARSAGYLVNDVAFGLHDTGQLTSERVLRLLEHLPDGLTEMYFHPAVCQAPEWEAAMPDYQHEREYEALISPDVRRAVEAAGVVRLSFSDLREHRGAACDG